MRPARPYVQSGRPAQPPGQARDQTRSRDPRPPPRGFSRSCHRGRPQERSPRLSRRSPRTIRQRRSGVCASGLVSSSLVSSTAVSVNGIRSERPRRTRACATRAGWPRNTRHLGIAPAGEHGPASIFAMSLIWRLAAEPARAAGQARLQQRTFRMATQAPRPGKRILSANRSMHAPSPIRGARSSTLTASLRRLRCRAIKGPPADHGAAGSWPDSAAPAKSAANTQHSPPGRLTSAWWSRALAAGVRAPQRPGSGRRVWRECISTPTPLAVGARGSRCLWTGRRA
jgi:hypothetical protein